MALISPILSLLFLFISQSLLGCDFHDFDPYQLKLTAKEVESKINTYLEKDKEVKNFYRLTPNALYIGDLDHQQVDYILQLRDNSLPTASKLRENNRLEGIKIAIDPGHFGGSFARLEERFIDIPATMTKDNRAIYFCEGDLTYLTALELQRLLKQEGALVLVTRSQIGQGAIKEDFFGWLQKENDRASNEFFLTLTLPQLFRNYYNIGDLKERAKIINAFSPDITIAIHYNLDLTEEQKRNNILTTKFNYNLAFIPGAFGSGELKIVRDRYEFLRLIVTNCIDESLKLSECVTRQFVKQLDIPLIAEDHYTTYKNICLFQKPGVYCRNLFLTRLVRSPICYGETLIQNNQDEIYRLSESSALIENIPCPKRIKEVALAYFEGIKEYFSKNE